MSVNIPTSLRTIEDSENGDGDHHLYTNTYVYEHISDDGKNQLGSNAQESTVSKAFTAIVGIFLVLLLAASGVAMSGVVQLRHSVDGVGFTCRSINMIGTAVLAASTIFILLSLAGLVLLFKGNLGRFHAAAFAPAAFGGNDSNNLDKKIRCCSLKKFCAILNLVLLVVLTVVIVIGALLSYSFFRLSTQVVSTAPRTLQGKDGDIKLVRDANGLPRIHAQTKRDALYAQGYAQAEDRLWELEFTRLVVQGRLAEKLGKAALRIDRQTRGLGFRRAAEQMCALTSLSSIALFQSYVDGINHYLDTRSEMPVEFAFMGKAPSSIVPQMRLFGFYKPEPFDVNLVCYAAKLIQWEMDGDVEQESQLFKIWWMNPSASFKDVSQLMNNYTNVSHTILSAAQLGISGDDVARRQREMYETYSAEAENYQRIFDPIRQSHMKPATTRTSFISDSLHESAANNKKTTKASKKRSEEGDEAPSKIPLDIFDFKVRFASNGWMARDLETNTAGASDPHLQITLPSVWHQIHLQWGGGSEDTPDFAISGVALAGMCGIGIGKRNDLFWSITAAQVDDSDLFVLNQTSPDSDTYFVQKDPSNPNGEYIALTLAVRTEVIKVLGQDDDVVLSIKESIYGSDVTDIFFETANGNDDDDDKDGSPKPSFFWSNVAGKDPSKAPLRFHMYSPVFRPDNSSADAFANTINAEVTTAQGMRQSVCSKLAAPAFSITVGDSQGGLSYSVTGTLQQRLPDHWGRWPHFATKNENDFYAQYAIPFEEKSSRVVLPGEFTSTFIGTANQKIYPDGYKYDLGATYDPGYRGRRIQTLMAEADPNTLGTLDTHRTFQSDHYSGMWLYAIKPSVLRNNKSFLIPMSRVQDTATYGLTAAQQSAWQSAQVWLYTAGVGNGNFDGLAAVGSTPISFVWKWIQEYSSIVAPLTRSVTGSNYWDKLLFIDKSVNGQAPHFVEQVLCKNYLQLHSGWYDIKNRDDFFGTTDLCVQAFVVAFLRTAQRYPDDSNLKWAQDLKPFHARNRMMTSTPLKCMFDRSYEKDGDATSLDVSDFSLQSENFVSTAASSMRSVYSSKAGQSHFMYFVMPGGASGNPFDKRYTNLMEMWRTEQYINTTTSRMN